MSDTGPSVQYRWKWDQIGYYGNCPNFCVIDNMNTNQLYFLYSIRHFAVRNYQKFECDTDVNKIAPDSLLEY